MEVHLEQNGKYWRARWTDHLGRRRSKGLGRKDKITRRAARTLARQLEASLNAGATTDENITLAELVERFRRHRHDLSERTWELYDQVIRTLTECFGEDVRIKAVRRTDASDWRADVAAGKFSMQTKKPSDSTIGWHVRHAKTLFQHAVSEGLLEFNPFDHLSGRIGDVEKDWAYVSYADLHRLIDSSPNDDWRLLFGLCRLAGLRQGEALRLRWSHVDWERKRLLVHHTGRQTTKKRKREVPISPKLHDLLFEAYMKVGESDRPIRLDRSNLWRGFRAICKRAGLEPWRSWCHTLRKNAEQDWLENFPPPVVAEWLGHSPTVAAKHYLRAEDSHFRRASETKEKTDPEVVQKSVQNRGLVS